MLGQVWSVTIKLGTLPAQTTTTASYVVASAGATLADIAAGLAAAINAQAQAEITAVAEGNQVFIVNRAGAAQALVATYAVAPAGALLSSAAAAAEQASVAAAVRAGDLYTVSLASGAASVSYTAVAGDTAAKVAKALAALINNSTDPDAAPFTAAANGATLYVVDRDLPAALITAYASRRRPRP